MNFLKDKLKRLWIVLISASLFYSSHHTIAIESVNAGLIKREINSININPIATVENLKNFQLPEPVLTEEEKLEVEIANKIENEKIELRNFYENLPLMKSFESALEGEVPKKIHVEIYEKSKEIGKQAVVVKVDGKVKYAFATSAGKDINMTKKVKDKIIDKQNWRHMSSKYPGTVNNMDHVSYFSPAIGFHSTPIGNYHKLGKADSHGCVRLNYPAARILYRLIKEAGLKNSTVTVYKGEDDKPSELDLVKKLLVADLNFIRWMILNKNNGNVAGIDEDTYFTKFINLPNDEAKLAAVKVAVENYNNTTLKMENDIIEKFNQNEESLKRPLKTKLYSPDKILELNHYGLIDENLINDDYVSSIYPKLESITTDTKKIAIK